MGENNKYAGGKESLKRGDASKLIRISCPFCKLGQAVNKAETYDVFTSKKYLKLRKARKNAPVKPLPAVGKDTRIEAALLTPALGEVLKPPTPPSRGKTMDRTLDRKWFKWLLAIPTALFGIWLTLYLQDYEVPYEAARMLGQLVLIVIIVGILMAWNWLGSKVEKRDDTEYQSLMNEYRKTWFCLRCGEHFIRNSGSKDKEETL